MGGCCGPACSKCFVVLYNILFWVSGCAFLALGVILIYDKQYSYLHTLLNMNADKYPPDIVDYSAYAFIGFGGLILFVGFFGCCGALQESKCMLGIYIFFLILICLVEAALALGVLYCYYMYPTSETIKSLKIKLESEFMYDDVRANKFTESLNYAQYNFECCGISGDTDYITGSNTITVPEYGNPNNQYNLQKPKLKQNQFYPTTCCVLITKENPSRSISSPGEEIVDEPWLRPIAKDENRCQIKTSSLDRDARHTGGCWKPLETRYALYVCILAGSFGGLALLQILGVLFSLCLIRNIGEEA